jgi:hypothetical protein
MRNLIIYPSLSALCIELSYFWHGWKRLEQYDLARRTDTHHDGEVVLSKGLSNASIFKTYILYGARFGRDVPEVPDAVPLVTGRGPSQDHWVPLLFQLTTRHRQKVDLEPPKCLHLPYTHFCMVWIYAFGRLCTYIWVVNNYCLMIWILYSQAAFAWSI